MNKFICKCGAKWNVFVITAPTDTVSVVDMSG